jgi:hypothetical protein
VSVDLTQVKLDLDRKWTRCGWTSYAIRMAHAIDILGLTVLKVNVRETAKGFHVVLTFGLPLESERGVVAVQAILGSDSLREAINYRRVGRGDDWNVLFLVKDDRPTKPRLDYARILIRALQKQGQKPTLEFDYGT